MMNERMNECMNTASPFSTNWKVATAVVEEGWLKEQFTRLCYEKGQPPNIIKSVCQGFNTSFYLIQPRNVLESTSLHC